jgi:hypothetical protein
MPLRQLYFRRAVPDGEQRSSEKLEERITKALLAGTNFDELYKMPTRTDR